MVFKISQFVIIQNQHFQPVSNHIFQPKALLKVCWGSHLVRDFNLSTAFQSDISFSSRLSSSSFLGTSSSLWCVCAHQVLCLVRSSNAQRMPYLIVSILFSQACNSSKLVIILKMPLSCGMECTWQMLKYITAQLNYTEPADSLSNYNTWLTAHT